MQSKLFLVLSLVTQNLSCVVSYTLFQHSNGHYCLLYGDQHNGTPKIAAMNNTHMEYIIATLRKAHPVRRCDFLVELPKSAISEFNKTGTIEEVPESYIMLVKFWMQLHRESPDSNLKFVAADKRGLESSYLWTQLSKLVGPLHDLSEMGVTNFKKTKKFKDLKRLFVGLQDDDSNDCRWLTIERYLNYSTTCCTQLETWSTGMAPEAAHLLVEKFRYLKEGQERAQRIFSDQDSTLSIGKAILNKIASAGSAQEAFDLYNDLEKALGSDMDFIVADAGLLKKIFKRYANTDIIVLTGDIHARTLCDDLQTCGWVKILYETLRDNKKHPRFTFNMKQALLNVVQQSHQPASSNTLTTGTTSTSTSTTTAISDENLSSDRPSTSTARCGSCDKNKTEHEPLKFCGRCGQVQYCSRECQRKDWRNHRPLCDAKSGKGRQEPTSDQN